METWSSWIAMASTGPTKTLDCAISRRGGQADQAGHGARVETASEGSQNVEASERGEAGKDCTVGKQDILGRPRI